jgi:hypothetical protein
MVAGSLRRLDVGALDALGDPDDRTRREADTRSHSGRAVKRRSQTRRNGDDPLRRGARRPDYPGRQRRNGRERRRLRQRRRGKDERRRQRNADEEYGGAIAARPACRLRSRRRRYAIIHDTACTARADSVSELQTESTPRCDAKEAWIAVISRVPGAAKQQHVGGREQSRCPMRPVREIGIPATLAPLSQTPTVSGASCDGAHRSVRGRVAGTPPLGARRRRHRSADAGAP